MSLLSSPLLCIAVLILVVFNILLVDADFYNADSKVQTIDGDGSFERAVLTSKLPVLVEFYAPWCGYCKALTPHWIEVAKQLEGKVKVVAVDCDIELNKPLAQRYGVKGFPTIKAFIDGDHVPYEGERLSSEIIKFGLSKIQSKAIVLKEGETLSNFFADVTMPKLIFFTDKKRAEPAFKALTLQFDGRMKFGKLQKKEKKAVKIFSIKKFPTFLAFGVGKGVDDGVQFNDAVNVKSLKAFVKRFALPGDEDDESFVPSIADDSCMKAHCTSLGGICVWLVTTPNNDDENKEYLATLNEAAESTDRTMFRFGWIDGSVQSEFMKSAFELSLDFPRLIAFSASKKRFSVFLGAFNVQSIKSFLNGVLSGRIKTRSIMSDDVPILRGDTTLCETTVKPKPKVKPSKTKKKASSSDSFNVVLKDSTFNKVVLKSKSVWMVEFFSPRCGHCQKLIPKWRKAADSLKSIVKFGTVDTTVETQLASRFDIKGVPTIKLFSGGKHKVPTDYEGPRTAKGLIAFAKGALPNKVFTAKLKTLEVWKKKTSLPKALFVVTKPTISPLVKAIALEFDSKMSFGSIVTSDKVLSSLKIEKAPALIVFSNDGAREVYSDDFSMRPLVKYLKSMISSRGSENNTAMVDDSIDEVESSEEHSVPILNTQVDFNSLCADKLGLCIIGFINADHTVASEQLSAFRKLSQGLISQPFHFVIINRTDHLPMADAFGVSGDSIFSVIAYQSRKHRFARFLGSVSYDGVYQFLERLRKGKQSTKKISILPTMSDGVDYEQKCEMQNDDEDDNNAQCSLDNTVDPITDSSVEKKFSKDEL